MGDDHNALLERRNRLRDERTALLRLLDECVTDATV